MGLLRPAWPTDTFPVTWLSQSSTHHGTVQFTWALSPLLHAGCRPGSNHACQFLCRSVKGFWCGEGSNFGFFNWLASSPLKHSRTSVRVCDRSFVRSKLDYGSVVYCFAREFYLRMLDPIQNHALRLWLGAFRTSPASSICVQANEPPLYIRRKMMSIQYSLSLGSSPSNTAYIQPINSYKNDYVLYNLWTKNWVKPQTQIILLEIS